MSQKNFLNFGTEFAVNCGTNYVAFKTCKTPKGVCDFCISKYFLFGERFLHDWSTVFLSNLENILELVSGTECEKTQTRFSSALVPEKLLNKRKTKFVLTCSFRKVIQTFAAKKRKSKIQLFFPKNSNRFKASFISFNLI